MHVNDDADAVRALITDRSQVAPEKLGDPQVDRSATRVQTQVWTGMHTIAG